MAAMANVSLIESDSAAPICTITFVKATHMAKPRTHVMLLLQVVTLAVVGTIIMAALQRQVIRSNVGTAYGPSARRRLTEKEASSAVHLFTPASFTTVGPSVFPKPSALLGEDARPSLQPTFGQHRPEADTVFVFAAEYGLSTYLCFVESLRRTGYTGDIVFAVSVLDVAAKGVKEYLTTADNLITYVLELNCFNAENEATSSSKGGMRVCQLHHLYADKAGKPLDDPREARTIATTRYELYWLWSLHYKPNVWMLLLDARDSYFQTNPFDTVPRDTDPNKKSGALHFFGVSNLCFY